MKTETVYIKKLALIIVFSALGVVLSTFTWFVVFGTKANPTQHMINAILGVLVGPFWAAVAAILVGTIRNTLGIGTLYAFPGGIPGGLVVGATYWLFKRFKLSERVRLASALTEPIGTLLVGAPIGLFLFASWLATESLQNLMAQQGPLLAFLIFAAGWALSCIPGSIIGFIILLILKRIGISRETLFGEK